MHRLAKLICYSYAKSVDCVLGTDHPLFYVASPETQQELQEFARKRLIQDLIKGPNADANVGKMLCSDEVTKWLFDAERSAMDIVFDCPDFMDDILSDILIDLLMSEADLMNKFQRVWARVTSEKIKTETSQVESC